METSPIQPVGKPQTFWVVWIAWALVLAVLVWSFGIDFLLSELKLLSFSHMVIWALMLLVSTVLFLVGFISAIIDLVRSRKAGTLLFRNRYIVRLVCGGVGLGASLVLIFLYGLMALTVGSKL